MRIALFYHSLISDWNHGNAHFLRGIVGELQQRGHAVRVYEPVNAWSVARLIEQHGHDAIERFHQAYPHLSSTRYDPASLDLDAALHNVDLAIVHEWNDAAIIAGIGEYRASHDRLRLLFHDTHHRSVSDQEALAACHLEHYDAVLAYGEVIRVRYLSEGWARQGWTWHEAADTRVFKPIFDEPIEGDLVWIGNWADDERVEELREFLLDPVRALGLRATVFGVRYPAHAIRELEEAGIAYGGWLPNYEVPKVFGRYRLTVHVPRRPYVRALPGIPTIRPFEAMACGIPLVSAPWDDVERLFHPGRDFLIARDGADMTRHLANLLARPADAEAMAVRALRNIRARHTCVHRVNELLAIHRELLAPSRTEASA